MVGGLAAIAIVWAAYYGLQTADHNAVRNENFCDKDNKNDEDKDKTSENGNDKENGTRKR